MRFSEKYGLTHASDDDWYDTLLFADTPLFIDPFLIWAEDKGYWSTAHDHLLDFFETSFDLIRESAGSEQSAAWGQAERLLLFPEPAEFCLGVAEGSPLGSGSGRGLQKDMLSGIRVASGLGMTRVAHMETIALFQGGVGADRISDSVCNILKSYFIQYTKEVCRRHGVAVQPIRVRNASWSSRFRKWDDEIHSLPVNVVQPKRRNKPRPEITLPILLTPERFLKDMPIANPDGFWNWSWSNMSTELRGNFNYDIARNVDRRQKARLARENPDAVALYLRELEESPIEPYPISADPKLLVTWYERGRRWVTAAAQREFAALNQDQFEQFTDAMLEAFAHGVESDSWHLLWANKRPREERAAQALFRSVVVHYCKANDIDLTGEADAGRGPVDFKFSQGWAARALVEVKLVKSSRFWDGLLSQQPTYQLAEGVDRGYFVAIAYTDDEYTDKVRNKMERGAELVAEAYGVSITAVLVDARPKKSASKTRVPALSDDLHGGTTSQDKDG